MQEEERKKSQMPAAASAKHLPKIDRQMPRLKKDAADLMQANAAQQRLIQKNQFDLHAAKAQIAELQKHQYIRQDFDAPRSHQHQQQQHQQQQQQQDDEVWYTKTTKRHSPVKVGGQYVSIIPPPTYQEHHDHPTARQPEVVQQFHQSEALEMFLKRASDDNRMRAREVGLKAMEKARPEKPLQELSSTDYMMWKRKFKDAAKHEGLTEMDILQELPKWFSGPAKEIVETAAIGTTEAVAEEEVKAAFKKMDVIFMASRANIPALFHEIAAESKISSADHKRHFHLASRLLKTKKIAQTCGELPQCYRKEILQEIINKRVPHLADKFWEKQHEFELQGIPFSFDNLVNMIETWAVIQRNKGVESKPAAVAAVATGENPSTYNDVVTNGKQKLQSTDKCNVCSGMHPTEECNQLLSLDVDARVQKLASCRLCFHCLTSGHSAKGCANRPTCQTCKQKHATILHGRTWVKKGDGKEVKRGGEKTNNGIPFAKFDKSSSTSTIPASTPSTTTTPNDNVITPPVEA